MMNKHKSYHVHYYGIRDQSLSSRQAETLTQLLSQHSAVMFKPFVVGIQRSHQDLVRVAATDVAQLIDGSIDEMGLHTKNDNLPSHPGIQWFYCAAKARQDSQTILCDGCTISQQFSPRLKKLCLNNKINYQCTIPKHVWQTYFHKALALKTKTGAVNTKPLRRIAQLVPGQRCPLEKASSVQYSFITDTVHKTLLSQPLTFASRVCGLSVNYQTPRVTFADGGEIAPTVWQQIKTITDGKLRLTNWQDKDGTVTPNCRNRASYFVQ